MSTDLSTDMSSDRGVEVDFGAHSSGVESSSSVADKLSRPRCSVLTEALFTDAATHQPWRQLICASAFSPRGSLTGAQGAALAYERLRALAAHFPDSSLLASDPSVLAAMHEWVAIADPSLTTVAGIHYNLFLGSLLDHDQIPERNLEPFINLSTIGTFMVTELAHGNDVVALETTATWDPQSNGFDLHTPNSGAAKFMPNTSTLGGAKHALVAARLLVSGTDHGVFLFLAPITDGDGLLPGIEITTLPDRHGGPVDHCVTSFHHVHLPRSALLEGEHGRLDSAGELHSTVKVQRRVLHSIARVTVGKLSMSAAALGVARSAMALAVRYAEYRHISGTSGSARLTLADLRSHHGPLLYAIAELYAMTFLHREVVNRWMAHTPAQRAQVERLVAITKGWITWRSRATIIECRERCGARGLFPANRIATYLGSVEGAITAEGDNLAIWCKAASQMLRDDVPSAEMLDGLHDDSNLENLDYLKGLLVHAEHLWLTRAQSRMQKDLPEGVLYSWNRAVTPALQAVAAHARRQAAQAFVTAAASVSDSAGRAVLQCLCRLFLLREVSACSGELLAYGYVHPELVRGLPDAIEDTTAALSPHMGILADAFNIPAEFFASIPMLTNAVPA